MVFCLHSRISNKYLQPLPMASTANKNLRIRMIPLQEMVLLIMIAYDILPGRA